MSGLYSEKYSFNSGYRQNAWIQRHYNQIFYKEHIKPAFKQLLASVPPEQVDIHITDLCCGDGLTTLNVFCKLANKAERAGKRLVMTGVDVSPAQIQAAQETSAQFQFEGKSELHFVQSPVEKYQPKQKSDMMMCMFGLHLLEKTLTKTMKAVCGHIARDEAPFLAVYPMRVKVLEAARKALFNGEWNEAFKDKIRFIADSNVNYMRSLNSCAGEHVNQKVDHPFTVSKEKFKAFFASWAPENRGLLKDGYSFDKYFEAVWKYIQQHPSEVGEVKGDEITFMDTIYTANMRVDMKKVLIQQGDARLFAGKFEEKKEPAPAVKLGV